MDQDKLRVIKIGRKAMTEFLYESIIENEEAFFDVDAIEVTSHFLIDTENGALICLIHKTEDEKGKLLALPKDIDMGKLLNHMSDTTNTLYAPNRYVELTAEELLSIQSGNQENSSAE